ncbi:hypothetical protein [Bacillus atrophaeus]|nr:hypothetical protein [Bacillus atrophaeus]
MIYNETDELPSSTRLDELNSPNSLVFFYSGSMVSVEIQYT